MLSKGNHLSLHKILGMLRNIFFVLFLAGILIPVSAQMDAAYTRDNGPISKESLLTEKWYYGLKDALSAPPGTVYKMSLRGNKIRKLTPEIAKLYNLQILILNDCKLKSLPDEIGQLKNLQELIVFKNKLVTLPENVGSLRHLEVLLASRNRLIYLPSSLRTLENLRKLDISFNQLSPKEVDDTVEALPDTQITY
jgi:Leucine-rich repeat (LRR) protein